MSASSTVPRHLRSWQSQLFISQPSRPAPLHAFLINLVISALCAGALAIWIFLFTDWWKTVYSVIGGVGAAGGVAWKAARYLPFGRRIKALPRWARLQLPHPSAGFLRVAGILNGISFFISILFLLALGMTFLAGSLVVVRESGVSQNDGDHVQGAQLLRSGNEKGSVDVQFGKQTLLWASWLQRKPVKVRVEGYPDRAALIRPWLPAKMVVPGSFMDGTLTLVFVPAILGCSDAPGCRMRMRLSGANNRAAESEETKLTQNIFWLGCAGSVRVPSRLVPQLGAALSNPLLPLPCQDGTELSVGDTLVVTVERSGSPVGCGTTSIAAAGIPDDFQAVLAVTPVPSGGRGQC